MKKLLTWAPNWSQRGGGGRWKKQVDGTVHFFGHGRSPDDAQSYRQAVRKYMDFLRERESSAPVEVALSDATVCQVCEKFLQHMHQRHERGEISAQHVVKLHASLQDFSAAIGPGKRFCCLGELDLEDYRSHTLRLPISPSSGKPIRPETAKGRLASVRTMIRWAYKMFLLDRLPRNLEDLVRMPSTGQLPIRVYTLDELKTLWQSALPRLRCWIALALNCGFGQTDIAELRCKEIDWENGYVERDRSKTKVKAKFKLWPLALGLLKQHRNPQATGDERVFISQDGNPLVWRKYDEHGVYKHSDSVKCAFERLQDKVGIDGHRGFYSLRKTGATLIEKIDPAVTDMYLAHAEPGQKRAYAERDWGRLERAVGEMESRLKDVLTDARPSGASPEPSQQTERTDVPPEEKETTGGNLGAS